MIPQFLKAESHTYSLIILLAKLNLCRHRSRPFHVDPKELWISNHDIKVFATRWVKTHRDR